MIQTVTVFGEAYSKKNSPMVIKLGNRYSIRPSNNYTKWEKDAISQLKSRYEPYKGDYPCAFGIYFFRKTRRTFDFNNLGHGIHDALTKTGIIPDDDIKHVLPYPILADGWEVDKENPRVVGVLSSIEESPMGNGNMQDFYDLVHNQCPF